MVRTETYRRPVNPWPALLIILAVVAGGLVAVNLRNHAMLKHGYEAYLIHRCLDDNGPDEVWQSRNVQHDRKYFQLCQLDDGRWGMRVIVCAAGRFIEKTTFIVGGGSASELTNHLSGKATPFEGWLSEVCK